MPCEVYAPSLSCELCPHPATPPHHSWIYRRAVLPILALLRMGATPETLAWSIAVGLLVGINPVIGTTTILCLGLTTIFRLNVVASQIANHAMFPLEIGAGDSVYSTGFVGVPHCDRCRCQRTCFFWRRGQSRSR